MLIYCINSCHGRLSDQQNNSDSPSFLSSHPPIPEERAVVHKEPVAEYKIKSDNPLNDWYFSVSLFETNKTFNYLMKIQFEEVRGEDTLKLPDLGLEPKPVIQKGKEKYSCVVGFMDQNNQFREYKLIYVENSNQLKVTTLKHYAVY
jgi:hypothetical protein